MRTYTQEEKQAVNDRVISGEPSAHILADIGIPKSTFYSWLRTYREEQNAANRRTVDVRTRNCNTRLPNRRKRNMP